MKTRPPRRWMVLGSLLLAVPCTAQTTGDWEAGELRQGPGYAYQLFSQQREGESFVRYQVRGTVDAPTEVVASAASRVSTDPARAPENQTRTVLHKDGNETIMLTEIDLPTPFTDRDIVTRGVTTVDPATGTHRIDFAPTEYASAPPKDGVMRLQKTGGFWEFVPDGAKRTKVTFETFVDLGGSLPRWFVSGGMAKTASANFEEVAKEAVGS